MNRDLHRRLARMEHERHQGAPTLVFADHWGEPEEADALLARWPDLVASGEASVSGGVLFVMGPLLTAAEWEARYCEPEVLH